MTHLQRFNEIFKNSDADAALVSSEVNQTWISDFEFQDGYVLVTKEKAYVITDFRYVEAAHNELDKEFEIVIPGDMIAEIGAILARHGATKVIFEESTLPVADLLKFEARLDGVTFSVGASEMIDSLRVFKDEDEIAAISKAQEITDAAFDHIVKMITPNMTEIDVALELEYFMKKNGAKDKGFDRGIGKRLLPAPRRSEKREASKGIFDYGLRRALRRLSLGYDENGSDRQGGRRDEAPL